VRNEALPERTTTSAPNPLNCLARKSTLWRKLEYRAGSEIFGEAEPADYVYHIRQGAVRTYKLLSDGRRQIGAFHLPGDIFGMEAGEFYRFTAEAIVPTTVLIARRQKLLANLAEGNISPANNVRDLITRTLEHAENHLLLLGRQTALEKVAAFLLEIDHRLERPKVIVLPMSRRDIADYLGLTVETVSRALSALRDEGTLSFIGQTQREIALHDRSRLAQHAMLAEPAVDH
jgi:CRP/FNR family transcriptional regulator, nitrogen fixation regulation protein